MIYKLYKTIPSDVANAAMTIDVEPAKSFLFSPNNRDYEAFKKQINADEAQLQDADGNEMTAQQAKDFVKELP